MLPATYRLRSNRGCGSRSEGIGVALGACHFFFLVPRYQTDEYSLPDSKVTDDLRTGTGGFRTKVGIARESDRRSPRWSTDKSITSMVYCRLFACSSQDAPEIGNGGERFGRLARHIEPQNQRFIVRRQGRFLKAGVERRIAFLAGRYILHLHSPCCAVLVARFRAGGDFQALTSASNRILRFLGRGALTSSSRPASKSAWRATICASSTAHFRSYSSLRRSASCCLAISSAALSRASMPRARNRSRLPMDRYKPAAAQCPWG